MQIRAEERLKWEQLIKSFNIDLEKKLEERLKVWKVPTKD